VKVCKLVYVFDKPVWCWQFQRLTGWSKFQSIPLHRYPIPGKFYASINQKFSQILIITKLKRHFHGLVQFHRIVLVLVVHQSHNQILQIALQLTFELFDQILHVIIWNFNINARKIIISYYIIEFLSVSLFDLLTLVVGSLAQDVQDDLVIATLTQIDYIGENINRQCYYYLQNLKT